jgi:hypothetical protein
MQRKTPFRKMQPALTLIILRKAVKVERLSHAQINTSAAVQPGSVAF